MPSGHYYSRIVRRSRSLYVLLPAELIEKLGDGIDHGAPVKIYVVDKNKLLIELLG